MTTSRSTVDHNGIRIVERTTARTARFATLGAEPEQAARIWFVLHGYGQLAARFLRPFVGVVPDDVCVVAPEALSRFYLEAPRADGAHLQRIGASWLTREAREREIADAIQWLDLVHEEVMGRSQNARRTSPVTGVLAFSQGVATAMRWMVHGAVRPSHVVLWAGGLANDVDTALLRARLSQTTLTLVAGANDHFATPEVRARVAAESRSWHDHPVEIEFDGTHQLDAGVLQSVIAALAARRG